MRGKFFRVTDYFALLQLPRSAVLGLDQIKAAYRHGMSSAHPDKTGAAPDAAIQLNEARRILSDPALRLRHLLELEGIEIPDTLPPHLEWDLAERIGRTVDAARTFAPHTSSDSILLKAVKQKKADQLEAEFREMDQLLRSGRDAQLEKANLYPRQEPLKALSAVVFFQKQLRLLASALSQLREKSQRDGPL